MGIDGQNQYCNLPPDARRGERAGGCLFLDLLSHLRLPVGAFLRNSLIFFLPATV